MAVVFSLNFPGVCAEAAELYERAFGARVITVLKYSEAGVEEVPNVDERLRDKVYRCEMELCGDKLFMSDVIMDKASLAYGTMSARVTLPRASDVHTALSVLKNGGWVLMPPKVSRNSACEVEVIDKYGVRWNIISDETPEFTFRTIAPSDSENIEKIINRSVNGTSGDPEESESRRIWARAVARKLGREGAGGEMSGRIMLRSGECAGIMLYGPGRAAGSAEVYAFHIIPEIWRRGAGHYMMDMLVACLARDGYSRCRLWAPASDMQSRFFFDDCGFSLVNEKRSPYKGYNEIRYELMLNEY